MARAHDPKRGSGWLGRRRPPRGAALWAAMLLMVLASMLLSACASSAQVAQAHANKAKLDAELTHARTDLSIPESLLTPITSQEAKVASGDGGFTYDYDKAAQQYNALFNQLQGVEKTALTTEQQLAQTNLQAFANILNERRGEGFIEVDAYQQRYNDAQQALTNAKTPNDFAKVSDTALAQTQALQALWPAYEKLQTLQSVIQALSNASKSAQEAQQFYDQDLQVFRDATTADHYTALSGIIDAQVVQLLADQATDAPYVASTYLQQFQAKIDLLRQYQAGFKSPNDLTRQYGNSPSADSFQQQEQDDAKQLADAKQLKDYVAVTTTVATQSNAMTSPLIKAKALYDYNLLGTLVNSAKTVTIKNESGYDGYKSYPLAYEYMGENGYLDNDIGIGPASTPQKYARTDADFEAADFRVTSLTANLRAMLDNYDPTTDQVDARNNSARENKAHEVPHAADLQLIQYYNTKITGNKVIIVSMGEQVVRYYQLDTNSGQWNLAGYSYVTTGNPGDESVPGFWTAINRHSPDNINRYSPVPIPAGYGDMFTSPEPPGSPGYYDPTPIHYDVAYHEFGFWLHDAWWRRWFGPETNLPHRDPAAFNGGSHGCVNIPYVQTDDPTTHGWTAEQMYNWTPLGTPIILY